MKASEIIKLIESYCPVSLAEDWDNVGLLCGYEEKEVNRVMLTLDVTLDCVKRAARENIDMIISHHPILFKGIKRINYNTPQGELLRTLIQNDINLYAAHTNMDIAAGGINDALAGILSLSDTDILDDETGLGRIGFIDGAPTLKEFAKIVKERLSSECIRVCGDMEKRLYKIAVASGSCSEVVSIAAKKGADVIITGDLKYHECIDFTDMGICLIDAGHYPTEIAVTKIFESILGDTDLEIVIYKGQDIFKSV